MSFNLYSSFSAKHTWIVVISLFALPISISGQVIDELHFRYEGTQLFNQAIEAHKLGKINEAIILYEKAILADPQIAIKDDVGLGTELLRFYRNKITHSRYNENLVLRMNYLENIFLQQYSEAIKKLELILQNFLDPKFQTYAKNRIVKFKTIIEDILKHKNNASYSSSIAIDGNNKQQKIDNIEQEIANLEKMLLMLKKREIEVQQEFHNTLRRSNRIRIKTPSINSVHSSTLHDREMTYTRERSKDIFEIRAKIIDIQKRLHQLKRQIAEGI